MGFQAKQQEVKTKVQRFNYCSVFALLSYLNKAMNSLHLAKFIFKGSDKRNPYSDWFSGTDHHDVDDRYWGFS